MLTIILLLNNDIPIETHSVFTTIMLNLPFVDGSIISANTPDRIISILYSIR